MTDERVMEILKKVENKEISPDDAVKLIEDLEATDQTGESDEIYGTEGSSVSSAVSEVSGELKGAGREVEEELKGAAREVGKELEGAAREVGKEFEGAAREVKQELEGAAKEVREELKDAKHEVSDALKEIGGFDGLGSVLNSVFSGLGEALRGAFSEGFRGGSSGLPRFEFVEVREGSFTAGLPELDFSHHNGQVAVDSWDRDTYRLEVKKIINALDEDSARKRAEESIEVTDSPDGLGVRLIGSDAKGVSVSIKASVPSHLRYNGKFRFHNGSVSLEGLQMESCAMNLHNGKFYLNKLSARTLTTACHNGKASLEHVDTGECHITMHNGNVGGKISCSKLTAKTHNGKVGLELSTRDELDCEIAAHNGKIDLALDKAEDIGYRVEYGFAYGKAHLCELADVLEEIESVKPKHGAGRTKWVGRSPGFDGKQRKISVTCSVHNGGVSIGWME